MLERLLIVGLGSIGTRHARLARVVAPGVKIAAWRHRAPVGPMHAGIDVCVTDLEAALAFQPQAAVIASPASKHLETAVPLAEAGVHLLIEKPIASSAFGVADLIDICSARGVTLMTGYNLRFLHSLERFRALLAERSVGRVMSVRAEIGQYLPSWRPSVDYRDSVSARADLGGGVLLELSHEIDYLNWLFGSVEWVSAITRRQSALQIDVEDTAHLTLGFAPQAGEAPVVAALSLDFIRHDMTRTCTVIGEQGTLRWDALAGRVERFVSGVNVWETLFWQTAPRDESYLEEWRHFLSCIESGARPLSSGVEGLAAVRVVDAARESAAKLKVVQVGRKKTGRAALRATS